MGTIIRLCFLFVVSANSNAGIGEFLPGEGDGSLNLIKQLFGDLVCIWLDSCTPGNNSTLFIELLGVVTGSLFLVAGGYYAVNVFTGLTHTARTGKFLGNWDSLAVPFWTGASAILIAPNPLLLGVAPIHAVVMLVVLTSIGPANWAWEIAVDKTGEGAVVVPYEVSAVSEESAEIPFSILRSEVCTWTIYRQLQEAGYKPKTAIKTVDKEELGGKHVSYWGGGAGSIGRKHNSITTRTISWGVEGFRKGVCGELSFPIKTSIHDRKLSALENLSNSVQVQNATAINQLITDVRRVAYSISYSDIPGHQYSFSVRSKFMQEAIKDYYQTIHDSLSLIYKTQSGPVLMEFKNNAKQGGWIYAAGWFWRMSEMQGQLTNAMRINNKTFKARVTEKIPDNIGTVLLDNYGHVNAMYDRISPTSGMSAEIRRMEQSGELDFSDQLSLALGKAISGIVVSEQENPLMAIKRVGDSLKTAGAALLGIGASIAWVPALGDSAQFIAPMINIISGLLISAGVVLGQWIPLMPYITFFFAIAGWLLLIASAFISASIWGFMHASPSGLHKAKPGYIFLLDLWLRPLLLVCGLITGYLVYIIMNGFLNETLFKTFALSSFTSVWDALGDVVIYVIVQLGLASLCFSFIWKIPAAATNIYSGTSNVLVAPGSEQANNQAQHTAMILAGIPGGMAPEPPKPDPSSNKGTGGNSSPINNQERKPEDHVQAELDNKELLPQEHTHTGEERTTSNETPQQNLDLQQKSNVAEKGSENNSIRDKENEGEGSSKSSQNASQYDEYESYFSGRSEPSGDEK